MNKMKKDALNGVLKTLEMFEDENEVIKMIGDEMNPVLLDAAQKMTKEIGEILKGKRDQKELTDVLTTISMYLKSFYVAGYVDASRSTRTAIEISLLAEEE